MSAKPDGWQRLCAADEIEHLLTRLDGLYAAQRGGDGSVYLATRIRRCEALLSALQGFPAAIAQRECTC